MKKYKTLFIAALLGSFFILSASLAVADENTVRIELFDKTDIADTETPESLSDSDVACLRFMVSEIKSGSVENAVDEDGNKIKDVDLSDYELTEERFKLIYSYITAFVQQEHPEMFYFTGTASYQYDPETGLVTLLTVRYDMSAEEIARADGIISKELEYITGMFDSDMSDLEKILLVHDYIVSNYEYDTTYTSRTLNSMIESKAGVCQGYSYLFKAVMDRVGIQCSTVPSNACNHMWNKVMVNNQWYNIDLTFDDPLYNQSRNITHKYFLVSDEDIKTLDGEENNQHYTWNEYKWDNVTPAETAPETLNTVINKTDAVSGATVYKDGGFYCFDDEHNLCKIDFENNSLNILYTDSSKYIWYAFGAHSSFYPQYNASYMTLYNGSIYFNSPDSVYRFKTGDNTAELVYRHDGGDPSETYFYGVCVKDGKLYAEYAESPNDTVEAFVEVSVKDFSSSVKYADGSVQVEVCAPVSPERYNPVMYIAEYNSKGLFIGAVPSSAYDTYTEFTPNENSSSVRVFIWGENNIPLSDVSSLKLDSSD